VKLSVSALTWCSHFKIKFANLYSDRTSTSTDIGPYAPTLIQP